MARLQPCRSISICGRVKASEPFFSGEPLGNKCIRLLHIYNSYPKHIYRLMYVYTYIHIYREREREPGRGGERETERASERERERETETERQ